MVLNEKSVWDVAIIDGRRRRAAGEESASDFQKPREATLLFVGSRGAGKTTLIQKFLDKEETTRPTLALEYTYARKSGKTLAKDVCHIWELGGGVIFSSLLSTPLDSSVLSSMAIFVVLDLSKPQSLWTHMELLLKEIKKKINDVISNSERQEANLRERLTEAAWHRIGLDHQDKDMITPSLVPLVLVGTKYDIFHDFEPESKKLICRALRYVAHSNGAGLHFFSTRDTGLIKKTKEVLGHFGFGTQESKSLAQDYNKPLIIPAGTDSFQSLSGGIEQSAHKMSYDAWKQTFSAKFPQEDEKKAVLPEDPSSDPNYAESDVDNLRSQKAQELERFRLEVGRNTHYDDFETP